MMTPSQRAVEAAWNAYQNTPIDLLADSDEETKRCVVNAIAAYHAALAVDGVVLQGWRTMDSAPKDTSVLISDGTLVLEAKFVSEHGFWLDPYGEREDPWIGNAYTPIRWMPLPPPPAASDGEERE